MAGVSGPPSKPPSTLGDGDGRRTDIFGARRMLVLAWSGCVGDGTWAGRVERAGERTSGGSGSEEKSARPTSFLNARGKGKGSSRLTWGWTSSTGVGGSESGLRDAGGTGRWWQFVGRRRSPGPSPFGGKRPQRQGAWRDAAATVTRGAPDFFTRCSSRTCRGTRKETCDSRLWTRWRMCEERKRGVVRSRERERGREGGAGPSRRQTSRGRDDSEQRREGS